MTTQEYVDYVSQFNRLSIEDLLNIIKIQLRLTKKTTESFVFSGSRYIVEAPEKEEERIKVIQRIIKNK